MRWYARSFKHSWNISLRVLWIGVGLYGLSLAGCSSDADERGSIPSGTSGNAAPADSGGEQYYQQLLAQYREDYSSCLDAVKTGAPDKPVPVRPEPQHRQLNVIVAFDSSGSMAGKVSDGTKIEVAKRAVEQFLGALPQEARVGLVVYGHQGSNRPEGKTVSCAGVEELYTLAELDRVRLVEAVQPFRPTGYTPLAAAIGRSGEALADQPAEGHENIVYVVSDGIETCGGDPVAAARALHDSAAKAIINIIGFDVGNTDQQQLRAVAEAGGGRYFSAQSGAELNRIFNQTVNLLRENKYQAENALAQSGTEAEYAIALGRFNACVGSKLTHEEARLAQAVNRLPLDDPKRGYFDYVQERTRQRRQQIETLQDRINNQMSRERQTSLDRLRRDLQEVVRDFQGTSG